MMKKLLSVSLAFALSALSFGAVAAPALSQSDASQMRQVGTVSASGAYSLDDLESKLSEKAREQGASGFVVESASAGGDNQMYGTATIYK